tara:strand:+ start:145 stop:300 length:156 start_codon:yes stop_codon:yes gene_type:complete
MTLPKAQILHIPIKHFILKQNVKKPIIEYCSLSNQIITNTPKYILNKNKNK